MDNKNTMQRDSSLELMRIVTMLVIIAHHYVMNSGLLGNMVTADNVLDGKSLFCLLFGWGGKTGINCFVLITGYFMCKSRITLKKFLKLLLEVEFYNMFFYFIFVFSGYTVFSIKDFIKTVFFFYNVGKGFTSSYLIFFLFNKSEIWSMLY